MLAIYLTFETNSESLTGLYASIGYLNLELFENIISKKPDNFQNLIKLALGMPKIRDDTDINYSKKENWEFYIR